MAPRHIKHVDELYGVATCLTCTALEARVVGGMLVSMYWGEGDCPGDRVDLESRDMTDDYGDGVDDEGVGKIPPYVPIGRVYFARCNRCGSIVEGDTAGTMIHDIWHTNLDARINQARIALPQRYAGSQLSRSAAEDFMRHDPGGAPSIPADK